jgi:hypothetical protein
MKKSLGRTKSVWAQSPAFWIGAGLTAEAPVALIVMSMDSNKRTAVLDYLLGSPVRIAATIVASFLLIFLVAWVAHRLGLGDD